MKVCLACKQTYGSSLQGCPACGLTPPMIEGIPAFAPDLANVNDGFHAGDFADLRRVEDSYFWFRSRTKLLVAMLKKYFPNTQSILEIGCGTGFVLDAFRDAFPRARISGTEIYSEGLRFARDRLPSAAFFQSDARHLPFRDEFDVVAALDVLEHIPEDEAVLGQMYEAIRPGGGALITVPQHMWLWSMNDEHACHIRRYERTELRAKLEGAGFIVSRMTSFVSLLLPLTVLSRMTRRSRSGYDPMGEYKISKTLNEALYSVLSLERRLITAGANFPAGGSLLAVAYKPGGIDSHHA